MIRVVLASIDSGSIKPESLSPSSVNKRLADVSGEHYEYRSVSSRDAKNGKIKQIHSMVEVDKTKTQTMITILNDRLLTEAISRNKLSVIYYKNNWLAIFGGEETHFCYTSILEVAVFQCLVSAFDGGEKVADLAPVSRHKIHPPKEVPPMPELDFENSDEDGKPFTLRSSIEEEAQVVIADE